MESKLINWETLKSNTIRRPREACDFRATMALASRGATKSAYCSAYTKKERLNKKKKKKEEIKQQKKRLILTP
jgi:hypothetical protein